MTIDARSLSPTRGDLRPLLALAPPRLVSMLTNNKSERATAIVVGKQIAAPFGFQHTAQGCAIPARKPSGFDCGHGLAFFLAEMKVVRRGDKGIGALLVHDFLPALCCDGMNRTHKTNSSQQESQKDLRQAPACLGCNLLAMPERCVEYGDGVRCDECA